MYFKIFGVVVAGAAVFPLGLAVISYLTNGRFETDEDLLNRVERTPETVVASEPEGSVSEVKASGYRALAPGMIGFLAVCLLGGGVLAWRLKAPFIGEYLNLSVNARAARARADEIMRRRGLDPNSYYHATAFVNIADPAVNEFLRQRSGIGGVKTIFSERLSAAPLRVAFFRYHPPEGGAVVFLPEGYLRFPTQTPT